MHTGLEEAPDGFARWRSSTRRVRAVAWRSMVTGGIAPNLRGRLEPRASQLSFPWQLGRHRTHHRRGACGGRQDRAADPARRTLSHITRSPSRRRRRARRSRRSGRARLTGWGVRRTIADYVRCAQLAQRAGYDGVGDRAARRATSSTSSSRLRPTTATTSGAARSSDRMRFPVEIVRRTRDAVGPRLHHHLPAVHARPRRRRQHVGRGRAAGTRRRGRRRIDHQHRHRLARSAHPDDRRRWCRARRSRG